MDDNTKPKVAYIGIVYDSYTPQVEACITRDLIGFQQKVKTKYRNAELVVVSDQDSMDRLLNALGIRRTYSLTMAKLWMQYKALDGEWPEIPGQYETVYQRNLFQKVKRPNIDPGEHSPYYLPEPGRVVPDIISLLRPAPNAYGLTDPTLALQWG